MSRLSKGVKVLRRVGGFLMILGFAGWFGAFVLAGFGVTGLVPSHIELPLGVIDNIAVDDAGRVYCAAGPYARVQVYSAEGKFIRGIHSRSRGGGITYIEIDPEGLLHVATARNRWHYVFDRQGRLLSRVQDEKYYDRLSEDKADAYDKAGDRYKVSPSVFWPRVLRIDPSGNAQTVVSTPILLWFIMMPLPAWLFALIGMVLIDLPDRLARGRKPGRRMNIYAGGTSS